MERIRGELCEKDSVQVKKIFDKRIKKKAKTSLEEFLINGNVAGGIKNHPTI